MVLWMHRVVCGVEETCPGGEEDMGSYSDSFRAVNPFEPSFLPSMKTINQPSDAAKIK